MWSEALCAAHGMARLMLRVNVASHEPVHLFNHHWEDLMAKEPRTSPRGRDARTGHFTTVKEARQHPSTHVVERVPKPGHGDTKKK